MSHGIVIGIAGLLVAMVIGASGLALWLWPRSHQKALRAYSGDGTIKDLSVWTPFGYARRYVVEFDRFPLDRNFQKTYTAKGLPRIMWSPARVDLRVSVDPEKFKAGGGHAIMAVTVVDNQGTELVRFQSELSKLRAQQWSDTAGAQFYEENRATCFSPDPWREYAINIRYICDPNVVGIGQFVIDTSGP